jgi:hypothetical protein
MSSAISSIHSKSAHWADEEPPVGAPVRRRASNEWQLPAREPVRVGRVLARFLMTFCVGVVATLAWQSYGDVARDMVARSFPRLGWLAPPAAPIAQADPAAIAPDHGELKAISFGLAGVRQRVDQIAAQLAASQEQITGDITTKLNAAEHDILDRISAPPSQPAAAPARKPAPTPTPPTVPTAR